MDSSVVRATSLSDFDEPTALAWGGNSNLLAVALPPRETPIANVLVLDPDALHEPNVLEVALVSCTDVVAFLSFSPVQAPLTLLTATQSGSIVVWKPRQSTAHFQPVAINTWSPCQVLTEGVPFVLCKFLKPPSSFRWPPKVFSYDPSAGGLSLEQRFFVADHVIMDDPAWLRTGIQHLISVDVTGSFYVYWHTLDGWMVTQGQSLEEVLPGKLICVDVTAGAGSNLLMVAVTDVNPRMACVLNIQGHPRAAQQQLPSFAVEVVSMMQPSVDYFISDVQFRADTLGKGFVALQRSIDCIAISKHTALAHDPSTYTEAMRAVLEIDPLEPHLVEKVSMRLSTDGSCLCLCLPGSAPSLMSLHSLSITDRLEHGDACSCLSSVFSPNGVSLAGFFRTETDFRLEIWSLSEASVGSKGGFDNPSSYSMWDAMRLAWALLSHADPWDICQRIHYQAKALPESRAYFSLFYLDAMLHRHPHHTRPQYADLLDRIKIRILMCAQDPALKAVLVDLYARRMIHNLYHGFTVTFLTNCQSSQISFSVDGFTEGDKASCRRWIEWTEELFRFICCCIKTWNERHVSTSETMWTAVPFIRLLADTNFMKRLSTLLYCFSRVAEYVYDRPLAREKQLYFEKDCCETVNIIHQTIKKGNPYGIVKDQESRESIEIFRNLASQIRKTCHGPVHLHYARLDGQISKEVMKTMMRTKGVKEATTLFQADIERKATELGLLPDRALKGYLFMRETERHHLTMHVPRRPSPAKVQIFDCLKGEPFIEDQLIYYATDQSCIVNFGTSSTQAQGEDVSRLDQTMLRQTAMRSPFTGCLWKKLSP